MAKISKLLVAKTDDNGGLRYQALGLIDEEQYPQLFEYCLFYSSSLERLAEIMALNTDSRSSSIVHNLDEIVEKGLWSFFPENCSYHDKSSNVTYSGFSHTERSGFIAHYYSGRTRRTAQATKGESVKVDTK